MVLRRLARRAIRSIRGFSYEMEENTNTYKKDTIPYNILIVYHMVSV
jgi:hypothetical protein